MKNKIFLLIILLLPVAYINAQGLLNNGASIVVKQGAELTISGTDGSFTNKTAGGSDGQVFLDGQISLQGSWYNNATAGNVFADPDETGLVLFENLPDVKGIQELGGTAATRFENLTVASETTAKILSGTEVRVIYNFTLNGTLEVNGDLYIEGTFTNNGDITGTGTVHYVGDESQVIAAADYPALELNNAAGFTLEDNVHVQNQLELTEGKVVLGDFNLNLGPDCILADSKGSAENWVDATGTGTIIKMFDTPGTFTFPVGNFGTTPVYSPVTIEITSATFVEASVSVRLKPEAHPETQTGPDFPNYLTRYWVVEGVGLSDLDYNIRFDYAASDVVGDEEDIEGAKFVVADGFWKHFDHVNAIEHYFDATGLDSFSAFTGVQENRNPTVSITYPADGSSIYDTTITITGTAYDIDGDLTNVFLRVNEGSWQAVSGLATWEFEMPLTFGNRKIEVRSVDYQGAESDWDETNFYTGIQHILPGEGWSHISAYLSPIDADLETIFEGPVNQGILTIMNNRQGKIFWPSENINTIGNWQDGAAYQLSMTEETEILFKGDLLAETSVALPTGSFYLPVLTNVETPIEEAFSNPMENVRIIFSHQTTSIYWPDGGIFTLSTLKPGMGYLANMKNTESVTFPDYDMTPATAKMGAPEKPAPGPWPVIRTENVHLVSVFEDAVKSMNQISHIGAFNQNGDCIGYADVSAKSGNVLLVIYGDDPYTGNTDGTEEGEPILLKGWNQANGTEILLEATWSPDFQNHDGLFVQDGLSAITDLKASSTGFGENAETTQISVYPNPAKDELNLVAAKTPAANAKIRIINASGSIVLEQNVVTAHTKVAVSTLQPGIYLLKFIQNDTVHITKIVIQ